MLRFVRGDDKDLLRAGFERLSPESRYLRFHGVKTELTEAELRYLTELDGVRHFAIGAIVDDAGLGIARMVQLDAEPGVAEAAITVLDEMQGKGLGSLLFRRLVAAAAERGIRKVRCLVLGSNTSMQDLLLRLGAGDTKVTVEQGVVTVEIELPEVRVDAPAEDAPRNSGLYRLLRLAAERVLEISRP
jgi:GNAT superfamily N-acetyltransferase